MKKILILALLFLAFAVQAQRYVGRFFGPLTLSTTNGEAVWFMPDASNPTRYGAIQRITGNLYINVDTNNSAEIEVHNQQVTINSSSGFNVNGDAQVSGTISTPLAEITTASIGTQRSTKLGNTNALSYWDGDGIATNVQIGAGLTLSTNTGVRTLSAAGGSFDGTVHTNGMSIGATFSNNVTFYKSGVNTLISSNRIYVGLDGRVAINDNYYIDFTSSGQYQYWLGGANCFMMTAAVLNLGSDKTLGWSGGAPDGSADTSLVRQAAGMLATPQAFTATNGVFHQFIAKTGNFTVTIANDVVTFNGTTLTATLLTAVGIQGKTFTIKNLNASPLTIATTSSQTIDGTTPVALTTGQSRTYLSDGANWIIVAGYL